MALAIAGALLLGKLSLDLASFMTGCRFCFL